MVKKPVGVPPQLGRPITAEWYIYLTSYKNAITRVLEEFACMVYFAEKLDMLTGDDNWTDRIGDAMTTVHTRTLEDVDNP